MGIGMFAVCVPCLGKIRINRLECALKRCYSCAGLRTEKEGWASIHFKGIFNRQRTPFRFIAKSDEPPSSYGTRSAITRVP